jgi:uncharacterized protein (TIGR03435 family)
MHLFSARCRAGISTLVCVPLVSSLLLAQPSFEVVSIKPIVDRKPGTIIFTGATVNMNSFGAFGVIQQAFAVRSTDIVGAPDWTKSDLYDIIAKTEEGFGPLAMDRVRPLLRSLLGDRFHFENRDLPIFELVIAKGGPKLKPSAGGDQVLNGRGHIQGVNQNIATLIGQIAIFAGRNVVDHTGLNGQYDYLLEWTPDLTSTPVENSDGVSLFTALQDQLGLQLRSAKGPVKVIVIDQIEKPSPN